MNKADLPMEDMQFTVSWLIKNLQKVENQIESRNSSAKTLKEDILKTLAIAVASIKKVDPEPGDWYREIYTR